MSERWARMALCRWSEPGDASLGARVRQHGATMVADEVLAGTSPLRQSLVARVPAAFLGLRMADCAEDVLASDLRAAERIGARYVVPGDSEWPTQLDDLGDHAPLGLWVLGAANLRLLALRSLAVVGARAATSYGEAIARELSAELTQAHWTTVSGGAFGIDAAAHRGALVGEGATVCVLAGGVDVPYPRSHASLLGRIREHGLLVSETPLGGAPMRQRFLTRNRVIAGITRGTVVVEAALRSGSRTTAREAASLRRLVMAFPGPVTSPMSAGCHALLREQRALLVASAREVIDVMSGQVPESETSFDAEMTPRELRVLDAVPVRRAATLDALARTAGVMPTDTLAALGLLESLGHVRRASGGWVRDAPAGRGGSVGSGAHGTMVE